MAAAMRNQRRHVNMESSSSSDEEERRKLQSSVWQPSNASSENKSAVSQNGSLPPSKREDLSKSFNVTDDYRITETTPEYKSFVAKKLTACLDKFLVDVEDDESKWQSKVKHPDDDDSFRLFSTSSTSYVPPKVNLPQAPWKRKKKKKRIVDGDSLSSSDSDEERLRLQSVAVSGDFILHGTRADSGKKDNMEKEEDEEEEEKQVTSNPVTSLLTNNTFHSGGSDQNVKRKKRKKKKKHELVSSGQNISENLTVEEIDEDVQDDLVLKKSKKDKYDSKNLNPVAKQPKEVETESDGGVQCESLANFHSSKTKKKKEKKKKKKGKSEIICDYC